MNNEAYIKAITHYLPERVLTNEMLAAEFPDWSVEKINSKIGVESRRLADDHEYVSDLAVKVSQKLFDEYAVDPSSIDFVLLCTQSPDYFLPTTACLVQHRLGIPTGAGAIDFNQGCSGYIYGLALAKGLLTACIAQNILLITAETYSRHIHFSDKGNRSIFGDAAAATLISTTGFASIADFELGTDGAGGSNLMVRNGAMRHPRASTPAHVDMGDYLFMDGTAIFNFTLSHVPLLTSNLLRRHRIELEDVDWFVFHQANQFMLEHLRKKIGIPAEKFLVYMKSCGNTVSSTIPIVLDEARKEGLLKSGQKILLAGFGVGYSWGGTLLTIRE